MSAPTTALPGFKGAKSDVLLALKKAQPLTAGELAAQFGLTANALRRHLKELQLAGLVTYRREVRGVGGPVYAFRLTENAERLFPQAYDEALSQALELVRTQFGSQAVVEIFLKRWQAVSDKVKPELDLLPLPERAQRLAALLTSLGYMAEATGGETATLREHNCTIRAVVEQFPEVCAAEERFIQDILGAGVTRQAHIAKGANCCEYCLAQPAALGDRAASTEHHAPAGSPGHKQETA